MEQKFFYVVDHSIPFPSSEYGGIWNVIASGDDECFDLISNHYAYEGYDDCLANLRANIMKADVFELADDSQESRIVASFLT
jgi:hypothetical protein